MPFGVWAGFGFDKWVQMTDDDDLFDLNQKRNLKFVVQWYSAAYYKGVARHEWKNRKLDASALDASTGKYRYLKEQCHPMPLSEILSDTPNVQTTFQTHSSSSAIHLTLENSYLYLMGILIFVAFCIHYYLKNNAID